MISAKVKSKGNVLCLNTFLIKIRKDFVWSLQGSKRQPNLQNADIFRRPYFFFLNGSLVSAPVRNKVCILKTRWHLWYSDKVPVLAPHQLQLLWFPHVAKNLQGICLLLRYWNQITDFLVRNSQPTNLGDMGQKQ